MCNQERTNLSFSNVYAFAEIGVWFGYHMEYLSSGRTLAKEDNFLGLKRNDITKNYLYTSEITESVVILVGPQPFFLKYKTFTATVKRRYFAILPQPEY